MRSRRKPVFIIPAPSGPPEGFLALIPLGQGRGLQLSVWRIEYVGAPFAGVCTAQIKEIHTPNSPYLRPRHRVHPRRTHDLELCIREQEYPQMELGTVRTGGAVLNSCHLVSLFIVIDRAPIVAGPGTPIVRTSRSIERNIASRAEFHQHCACIGCSNDGCLSSFRRTFIPFIQRPQVPRHE